MHWIRIVLIGLFLFFVAASGLWIVTAAYGRIEPGDNQDKFWIEVGKAGSQLAVVVVLAPFVSFLLNDLNARGNERRRQSKKRQIILRDLRENYDAIKRSRRQLRADGLTDKYGSAPVNLTEQLAEAYEEQMTNLNDAQLRLEGLVTTLKTLPTSRFGKARRRKQEIIDCVNMMKGYIGEVITEFEHKNPAIKEDPKAFSFKTLEKLRGLTGEAVGSTFKSRVSIPFHHAEAALVADI
jgi:hypothetical protein